MRTSDGEEDAAPERSPAARSRRSSATAALIRSPRPRPPGRRLRASCAGPRPRRRARPRRPARRRSAARPRARAVGKSLTPSSVSTSTPRGRASSAGGPALTSAPAGDDRDVVADQLDLAEQVRVQQDRDAAAAQLLEQLADDPPARPGRARWSARRAAAAAASRPAPGRSRAAAASPSTSPRPACRRRRRARPARAARRARPRRPPSRRGAGAARSTSSARHQPGKRKSSAR